MSSIDIAPLPEGWQGGPDDLLQWICNNGEIITGGGGGSSGNSFTGVIGGSKPQTDVGIWFSPNSIERYVNGAYQPISDVPVGAALPWFGSAGSAPENYLYCDGRSLIRADYPQLFAAIGEIWGSESGTTFSLPAPAGRVPVGAGRGDYELNQLDGIVGFMNNRSVGDYFGKEWLRKEASPGGAPSTKVSIANSALINPASGENMAAIYQPAFAITWIIRYR